MTRKRIAILLIVLLVVIVGLIVFFVQSSTKNTPTTQAPTVSSIDSASTEHIQTAISHRLTVDGNPCSPSDVTIDKKRLVDTTWVVTQATLTPLPEDDEARTMIYVLQVVDKKLNVIGYSGDGFSANSFPSGTPASVIKAANSDSLESGK